jgi:hypothetical protein
MRRGLPLAFIGQVLRLLERLQQRLRDPAVLLVQIALDHDRMHDREDAGFLVVALLLGDEVGK